ncbi:MAG: aminotransferase class I/II-fold pyridoxal phosphate-dependent enzyme [Thermomicrobiales bacterium]
MTERATSLLTQRLLSDTSPLLTFFLQSRWAKKQGEPGICDFVVGNPHEPPIPAFGEALARWSAPHDNAWYAYRLSEPASQEIVAESLRTFLGIQFTADDVSMTNGAFAGLAASMRAVVDPGDEVIYNLPPWFFYETLIRGAGAEPAPVAVRGDDFDLDLDAIAAAMTPRTRGIIVNSPNNPTGRIYPESTLRALAEILTAASDRNGRPIYLFSDEAYSRIVFDGRRFVSPVAFYPYSFLIYTYGKTLLTPGQRLGYVALPPDMPDRESLRGALLMAQVVSGYAFPNALLQHALPDIEPLSIDIAHYERKRDRMVAALRSFGYELHSPEGTFYLLPKSPIPDDMAFADRLAERDVYVLPGSLAEIPSYCRISLTASDEMIERALPVFADCIQEVAAAEPATVAASD